MSYSENYCGVTIWYSDPKLTIRHRDNAPAVYDETGRMQLWYQNGLRHRVDAPAVITYCGNWAYYNNDKLHRLTGPAVMIDNTYQYWVDGVYYPEYLFPGAVSEYLKNSTGR